MMRMNINNYTECFLPIFFYERSHQIVFNCLEPLIKSDQVGADELKERLLQNGQWDECGGDVFLNSWKNRGSTLAISKKQRT